MSKRYGRRTLLGTLASAAGLALLPSMALGQSLGALAGGNSVGSLLLTGIDNSLNKLSKPEAFYNDAAIRILLPSFGNGRVGGALNSALNVGNKLGVTDTLVRQINEAAGLVTHEAKPIFKSAVNAINFINVPSIVGSRDGGTRYLKSTSGVELAEKLRPLVDQSLMRVGALQELDHLNESSSVVRAAGISRDSLAASVTEQALDGIFQTIGEEEVKLRTNPLGGVLRNKK